MFAIRLIGTNEWILRIPGHARVRTGAGSTWANPPALTDTLFCEGVMQHVCGIEGLLYDPQDWTARRLYGHNPGKYLEVVRIEFKEIP